MTVRELLRAFSRVTDTEQEVIIHTVDVNPYNGMRELLEAGPVVSAYREDSGPFIIEGSVPEPDEGEED